MHCQRSALKQIFDYYYYFIMLVVKALKIMRIMKYNIKSKSDFVYLAYRLNHYNICKNEKLTNQEGNN